jgi:hypothetical protein
MTTIEAHTRRNFMADDGIARQQREVPFTQGPVGPIVPLRLSTGLPWEGMLLEQQDREHHEEWKNSVSGLQQWICELLLRNQQLRFLLQAGKTQEEGEQLDWGL